MHRLLRETGVEILFYLTYHMNVIARAAATDRVSEHHTFTGALVSVAKLIDVCQTYTIAIEFVTYEKGIQIRIMIHLRYKTR